MNNRISYLYISTSVDSAPLYHLCGVLLEVLQTLPQSIFDWMKNVEKRGIF